MAGSASGIASLWPFALLPGEEQVQSLFLGEEARLPRARDHKTPRDLSRDGSSLKKFLAHHASPPVLGLRPKETRTIPGSHRVGTECGREVRFRSRALHLGSTSPQAHSF